MLLECQFLDESGIFGGLLQTGTDLCAKERSAQHEGVQRRALSTSDGEQGEHSDCSADVGREEVLDMVSELHARQRVALQVNLDFFPVLRL